MTITIGKRTKVWKYSILMPGATVGDDCTIGSYVFIGKNVIIGNKCKVQNYACIYQGVKIGDGVFIGPHVCFTNDKYPKALNPDGTKQKEGDWELLETIVEDGASIGAGSIILPSIKIGRNAMVGAGSIVTKNVPEDWMVRGRPAKIMDMVTD